MSMLRMKRVLAGSALLMSLTPSSAAADQIWVGTVTCITLTAPSCPLASGLIWWRVVNTATNYDNPYPGSNDLLDINLEFRHADGTMRWHWDSVAPGAYVETEPFDASLLGSLGLLHVDAGLARTAFDPLFPDNPYLSFTAESARVSADATGFPPPLDLWAQGEFVSHPTPEPATLTLLGLGLAGIATARRRRRR